MNKKRLVILSDLWGNQNNDWLSIYLDRLMDNYNCVYYDVQELAGINSIKKSEKEVHQEFLDEGINKAVEKLRKREKKKSIYLCFSIGGTIAWKASLKGLPIVELIAISSTRLRKEYQKPTCKIQLHFGDQDTNRPMDEWFEEMEVYPEIHFGKDHEMYKKQTVAEQICRELNSNIYF